MLIAVLSDTHRYESAIKKAVDMCKDADKIIHLGDNVSDLEVIKAYTDKEIISVRGNCDSEISVPSEKVIDLEGTKIFLTHGHNYGVKTSILRLKYRAEELGVSIALYGHSHIPFISKENGVWLINPGSVSLSKTKDNTMAFIEINKENIYPYIKVINS